MAELLGQLTRLVGQLTVTVTPTDGIWVGGEFQFRLAFPLYPPACAYLGPTRL